VYEEKETDVNIAISMIKDAAQDVYDTAILVSGDTDLRPVVATVKQLRPNKRIVVAVPRVAIAREVKESSQRSLV
jgi:uncharacterized LabA/DUF88 family protein